MKIVCVSDTHLTTSLRDIPDGDILIHAGDALNWGNMRDLVQFRAHLVGLQDKFKEILYTPGNHCRIFEEDWNLATSILSDLKNVHVLHDHGITIGGYKFYGTSWQPFFCNWAFNVDDEMDLVKHYARIPDDIDVLITHCPPLGILDQVGNVHLSGRRAGSPELRSRIEQLKNLKLHVFGHIHHSRGVFKNGNTTFVNAAICNERYEPDNEAIEIELPPMQMELF